MAIRPILKFPDPGLRLPTHEVSQPFDDDLRALVTDMIESMYAAAGAGLAAIQIGSQLRIFVVDGHVAGGAEDAPAVVFINPQITWLSDETDNGEEGCLSFPGVFVPVKRALRAKCRAQDLDGNVFELEGEGLLARAFQHEVDHLNGRLLIDQVGPVKRELIKRKLRKDAQAEKEEKEEREEAAARAAAGGKRSAG